jgi:hypothetical protein
MTLERVNGSDRNSTIVGDLDCVEAQAAGSYYNQRFPCTQLRAHHESMPG